MKGDKGQRRLREIRNAVRDHQVAGKAQGINDPWQQGEAEQRDAAGGAVVPGPANDEPERQDDDDGAVGRQRGPLGSERQAEGDPREHDHPPPAGDAVGVEVEVEEEVGEHDQRDRDDVDDRGPRLDERHPVKGRQHAGGNGKESDGQQLASQHVHQRDERGAEERRHEAPAEGVETEKLDAERDDQLGERRLRIEVIATQQVIVGVVGEVELVEHEGRVGSDVVRLAQAGKRRVLVVVADAPGADGRRRCGVGEDIQEDRAAKTQDPRDQRERDQPVEVAPVEAPPGGTRLCQLA